MPDQSVCIFSPRRYDFPYTEGITFLHFNDNLLSRSSPRLAAHPPSPSLVSARMPHLLTSDQPLFVFSHRRYDIPYTEGITADGMRLVPADAKYIFVGARSPAGDIRLGAVGLRDEVLRETEPNTPHEHNGVW
jgi:hypothetical protein